MAYRILINREECEVRVAFLDNQQLMELHTEKFDDQTIVNNIYRGRVQDVVPGLQAAFIDVGLERNMFLHFMDIRPEALVLGASDAHAAIREASKKIMPGRIEQRGRRPRQDPDAPQAAPPVKRGDEIVIQVLKDEISGKAPRVTSNMALAGRYLVMLPFPSQEGGVSRKIATGPDRFRLKKLLSGLRSPDYSFIVRTAGLDQPEDAIRRDAENLVALWERILEQYHDLGKPGLLNNDHDLIIRLVRDAFPSEFDEVICDNPADTEAVRSQLSDLMPDKVDRVKTFDGKESLFEHFGVEKQIEKALDKKYWLPSGGSLIIDENEALTAIDVNTGRFIGKRDQEKTSLKTNVEACEAIANLIRLRDIGGIIVIDFIDMLSRSHQERVGEELRKHLRRDRAKTAMGRIGDFGLMVLTRKRQRMSLLNQVSHECPYCKGTGFVRRPDETFRRLKYDIERTLQTDSAVTGMVISAHPKLIDTLTSRYLRFFERLKGGSPPIEIVYHADPDIHLEEFALTSMKRPGEAALRVAPDRIADEVLVLPSIAEYAQSFMDEQADLPEEVEEESEVEVLHDATPQAEEMEEPAKAAEETETVSAERGEGTRRKRRRRESSSERRARRRRARLMAMGINPDSPEGQRQLAAPPTAEERALERAEAGEPPEEIAADSEAEEPLVASEESSPEQSPAGEDSPRRRTRRGSRGGRNRRRREEGDAAAPAAAEVAAVPEAPKAALPQPPPLEPLVLKLPPRKTQDADLIESFLDKIERQIETMNSETAPAAPAAPATAPAAAAAAKPAAPAPAAPAEAKPASTRSSRRGRGKPASKPKSEPVAAEKKIEPPPPPPPPAKKTEEAQPKRPAKPRRTSAKPAVEAKPAASAKKTEPKAKLQAAPRKAAETSKAKPVSAAKPAAAKPAASKPAATKSASAAKPATAAKGKTAPTPKKAARPAAEKAPAAPEPAKAPARKPRPPRQK